MKCLERYIMQTSKKYLNLDWENRTVENNIYGILVDLNEFNRYQSFLILWTCECVFMF